MEISPYQLTLLLSWSVAFGLVLGVLNDLNRIIRAFWGVKYSKKHLDKMYSLKLPIYNKAIGCRNDSTKSISLQVMMFFQDILFFIAAGVGIIVLNYEFNNGSFRFFTVFAVILGFLIYYFTLGKLVMIASEVIVFLIKASFLIVFSIICKPIVFFWRFFVKKSKKIISFLNNALAKIRKRLYNNNRKKEINE